MTPLRALLLAVPVALAACGGGDEDVAGAAACEVEPDNTLCATCCAEAGFDLGYLVNDVCTCGTAPVGDTGDTTDDTGGDTAAASRPPP